MRHHLIAFLPVLLLSACTREAVTVPVRFAATWDGQAVGCTAPAGSVALSDLRFFVSELGLRTADGRRTAALLAGNGRWQGGGVALVDLENASGNCLNGTPDSNDSVIATLPPGDYRGLDFVVGVPFAMNHANPLSAPAPLDDSSMHWHWRSGYKFLRAGMAGPEGGFLLHLGSAGCEGQVPDIRGCRYPNRVTVTLDEWQPGMTVVIDLQVLAQAVSAVPGDARCESGPADADCGALLPVLGLADSPGTQQLFRVRAP